MIALADSDQRVYMHQGRKVSAVMADWHQGSGEHARLMGRRPISVVDIDAPPPGVDAEEFEQGRVLWSIESERHHDDPSHPEYLQGLRRLMSSSNPKDWSRVEGTDCIDFDEFVGLVIPSAASRTPHSLHKSKGLGRAPRALKPVTDEIVTAAASEAVEAGPAAADEVIGPYAAVRDGRAAFGRLLREFAAPEERAAGEQEEEEEELVAVVEESPVERMLRQVRSDEIQTVDLRRLPFALLDSVLLDMAEAISSNTSVRRLHLDALGLESGEGGHGLEGEGGDSGPGRLLVMVDAVSVHKSLTTLTLDANHLHTATAAGALGLLLRLSSSLRSLSLKANRLGLHPAGAKSLAEKHLWPLVQNLPHAPALESLDLSDNAVDDLAACALAHALAGHSEVPASHSPRAPQRLHVVRLSHNCIGPAGLRAILGILRAPCRQSLPRLLSMYIYVSIHLSVYLSIYRLYDICMYVCMYV